jgi:hypothetical protein
VQHKRFLGISAKKQIFVHTSEARGLQIFQKSRSQLKIIGTRQVMRNKSYSEVKVKVNFTLLLATKAKMEVEV